MGTHVPFAHLNDLFLPPEGGPTQYDAQNESGKKMWTEYMNEAEKYDNRAAEAWKDDSTGILVFTGLFSATVGAFIIEFYKKLSPDSGDQTVALLCQMSAQLPNFTTGTCTPPTANGPSSPSASIIWVNAMWLMSLILSLTSALFATLLQQWARRYVQMPQIPSEPDKRARVRSFLFFGTQKFKMRVAVETGPTLLHVSVFLFFVGLVILFYDIHKTVAIIVSISVGIFVVAYFALTVLPCIKHNCPYRTPMSNIWWQLHDWIVPLNLGDVTSGRQHILVSLLDTFERGVDKHGKRLKDGLRQTIVQGALQASDIVDVRALTWWLQLPAQAEESKAQDFLACIPEKTVIQLMRDPDPIESRKQIFREHLLTLLRSCGPGSLSVGLNENERKTRLLVCLHAIHRIAHASINDDSDVDVDFVRSNFANISFMRAMWADNDTGIRVISRSICALLARCLLRKGQLEGPELGWLQDVTGESSYTIFNSNTATLGRMNLKAFVYGLLLRLKGDLPAEHATSFTETLAILMDARIQRSFDRTIFKEQLSSLVERTEQDATEDSREVVEKLRRMFGDFLPAPAPASTAAE